MAEKYAGLQLKEYKSINLTSPVKRGLMKTTIIGIHEFLKTIIRKKRYQSPF